MNKYFNVSPIDTLKKKQLQSTLLNDFTYFKPPAKYKEKHQNLTTSAASDHRKFTRSHDNSQTELFRLEQKVKFFRLFRTTISGTLRTKSRRFRTMAGHIAAWESFSRENRVRVGVSRRRLQTTRSWQRRGQCATAGTDSGVRVRANARSRCDPLRRW